jgi:hypothetical protein
MGLIAPQDTRRPASLILFRGAIVGGALALMGASAFQSITESAAATYTTLLVVQAVVLLHPRPPGNRAVGGRAFLGGVDLRFIPVFSFWLLGQRGP